MDDKELSWRFGEKAERQYYRAVIFSIIIVVIKTYGREVKNSDILGVPVSNIDPSIIVGALGWLVVVYFLRSLLSVFMWFRLDYESWRLYLEIEKFPLLAYLIGAIGFFIFLISSCLISYSLGMATDDMLKVALVVFERLT